jgi:uncharacterized protein DUF1579
MKHAGMALAAILFCAAAALAQMEAPKPGPELKKLDLLAGTWTIDADLKAGPMGPGGKITETEKCVWQEGGFYLICNSNYTGAMGSGVGLSVMGYSTEDKVYTYHEFNSWGEADDSKGTIDGDTWTWTNESKMGGMTMKGKYTMKVLSPTSYSMSYEMSQDGTKWMTAMDGKATKK